MAKTITLSNLTAGDVSLDIKLDEDNVLRKLVPAAGSLDLTGLAELDELELSEQLQSYLDGGTLSLSVTSGSNDLPTVSGRNLIATDSAGLSATGTLYIEFAAAAAGTPDDVTVSASLPFPMRILDVQLMVDTPIGASTCTLRDATGGLGNALSDDLDSGSAARVRDAGANVTVMPEMAAGDDLYLRRSDRGVAGELLITYARI